MIIDPMHGIFMGVTKKMTKLWLSPKLKENQWNIAAHISTIDQNFAKVKVPHDFGRKPRNLEKNMNSFKGNLIVLLSFLIAFLMFFWFFFPAEEWRNWLLYFSLPMITEWLPQTYKSHWKDFVELMWILCNSEIDLNVLDQGLSFSLYIWWYSIINLSFSIKAERKLKNWIYKYQNMYGKVHMTINIHNLNHFVDYLRMFGPIHSFSCFPFEDMMGFIKRRVHSTKDFMKTFALTSSMYENMTLIKSEVFETNPDLKVMISDHFWLNLIQSGYF